MLILVAFFSNNCFCEYLKLKKMSLDGPVF